MGKSQPSLALTSARSNDATKSFSTANDRQGRPVVSFSKQAELKIIKDQGQPSLFCRGGGTQAYAILEHLTSPHCFLKAQDHRCVGSDDPQDQIMFDFNKNVKLA